MSERQTDRSRQILIEGLSPEEIISLPDEHVAALVNVGPIVFRAGSASVLGQIQLRPGRLVVELAQIDGGGEAGHCHVAEQKRQVLRIWA